MKKITALIFAICSFFVINNNIVLADDTVLEFQTVATITNSEGATAYEVVGSTTIDGSTGNDYNNNNNDDNYGDYGDSYGDEGTNNNNSYGTTQTIPKVSAVATIPYNAVVYGDSVSFAPIAQTVLIVNQDGTDGQRVSMYSIKYNDSKLLIATNDVSKFKLIDAPIEEQEPAESQPDPTANVDNNATTGTVEVIITWIVAAISISLSFYYFIRYTRLA